MKTSKIKKILKNRIFLCTLTALTFGTIGVSAATYFPSNDVTYDNSASGLSSTNVQGAIDELYNVCKTTSTGGDGILDKVDIVTSGDGLYKDEYENGKYTYKGANPNNYVTFNNDQAGWRIISINKDGTIKIMRETNISSSAWDSSASNNWARPATLNTYLNENYYNRLTSTAQSQIVSSNYGIGAIKSQNNDLAEQINDETETTWYGKVALPTVSEYIRSNSNKSSCGTFRLNNNNYKICINTTWMYNSDKWWTLSTYSGSSSYVFHLGYNGGIGGYIDFNYAIRTDNSANYAIRPVVYLSSSVQITGGDGSQSNPYTIS